MLKSIALVMLNGNNQYLNIRRKKKLIESYWSDTGLLS